MYIIYTYIYIHTRNYRDYIGIIGVYKKYRVGSGFLDPGFGVSGVGLRMQGLGFTVQGLGFRLQGLGLRVWVQGTWMVVLPGAW